MEAKIKKLQERIDWKIEDSEADVTKALKNIQQQLNRIQENPDVVADAVSWIENATKHLVEAQTKVNNLREQRRELEYLLK